MGDEQHGGTSLLPEDVSGGVRARTVQIFSFPVRRQRQATAAKSPSASDGSTRISRQTTTTSINRQAKWPTRYSRALWKGCRHGRAVRKKS